METLFNKNSAEHVSAVFLLCYRFTKKKPVRAVAPPRDSSDAELPHAAGLIAGSNQFIDIVCGHVGMFIHVTNQLF